MMMKAQYVMTRPGPKVEKETQLQLSEKLERDCHKLNIKTVLTSRRTLQHELVKLKNRVAVDS